ncbi:unnamed protein product, partial [marine sediment metagenome]
MRCLRTNYPTAPLKRTVMSLAVMLALAPAALAQDFAIDWWTVDGGGEMFSSGGDFELSGTIGQPDAGTLAGGDYALTGGFWFEQVCGDCNYDGGVDLFDFQGFETCLSGPDGGLEPGCSCLDFDGDEDVDL